MAASAQLLYALARSGGGTMESGQGQATEILDTVDRNAGWLAGLAMGLLEVWRKCGESVGKCEGGAAG